MRILSLAPLAGPGLDALRALGDVTIDPWNASVPLRLHSADELRARIDGVDVLIVEADHVSAESIEGSSLSFIGVCRGDPVNIDLAAATKQGIAVIRTPGRNAGAVAELTLGLMFALLRGIVAADDEIRAGRWIDEGSLPQQRHLGRELSHCTVGVVGYGAIGRAVAGKVRALGASVYGYDPNIGIDAMRADGVEAVSLGELLTHSDIVTLHVPLAPETKGMIDAGELAMMKPGALLINTARYGLVAEEPLLEALRAGRIAAGLDHFENEILPADHPLTSMPNVVLTPHIAGSTLETIENHTATIAHGIREVLEGGSPPSVVNPEVLPLHRP